uniref:Uncharacterized protein n=2 Tax=Micrurus TaxID=8634 RepID=A0A2D4FCL4_MICCO
MLFGEEAFCYSLCHYFEGHTSKKKEPFFKAYLAGVSPSMAEQGNSVITFPSLPLSSPIAVSQAVLPQSCFAFVSASMFSLVNLGFGPTHGSRKKWYNQLNFIRHFLPFS